MNIKEKIKKNLKYILIIIAIMIVYIIIAILVNGKTPISNSSGDYLIVRDTLILQKQDRKWTQVTELNNKLLNKKYTIYVNNKKTENINVQYASDKWYFFTEEYDSVSSEGFQVAYNKTQVKPKDFEQVYYSKDDEKILKELLQSYSIKLDYNFEINTRYVEEDFDGDGKKERIYTTSNASLSEAVESPFAATFMVQDGKIKQVLNKSNDIYRIYSILDIDNDGVYELIIVKGDIDISRFDSCYQIYKIKDKKWKLIKDCEGDE